MGILDFEKPKTIAQWLIFIAAMAVTLSSPVGTKAFINELAKHIFKKTKASIKLHRNISKTLYELKRREIVEFIEKNGVITMCLTEKGKKKKLQYDFENLKIVNPPSWDHKWRLLIFDVPEYMRRARNTFRDKLKELGFLQFQKSVWLYPYPCEDEIDFISEVIGVSRYLTVLTANIEDDGLLRRHFMLSS